MAKTKGGLSPAALAKSNATRKREQERIAANVAASKRSTDIPLANIPDRMHRTYTDEFKTKAGQRVLDGESPQTVADELDVVRSLVSKWAQRIRDGLPITDRGPRGMAAGTKSKHADSATTEIRAALERAQRARDQRLDTAALIVESDVSGREGADLAKKIRTFKRAPT